MRDLVNSEYRLGTRSLPLRVSLSAFLGFVAIGEISGIVMSALHTGFTPSGTARYYRGLEAEMAFPKEFWTLIENTHFHVFIVPMVLLVLTHLMFMTRFTERTKVTLTLIAYGSALIELISPWLVRYGAASMAWLKVGGSLVFHATMIVLIVVPLYEAWFRRDSEPD